MAGGEPEEAASVVMPQGLGEGGGSEKGEDRRRPRAGACPQEESAFGTSRSNHR